MHNLVFAQFHYDHDTTCMIRNTNFGKQFENIHEKKLHLFILFYVIYEIQFFAFFWISNYWISNFILFYFSYFNIFWYFLNISSMNNYTIRELNQKIAIYKLYFNYILLHFHDKNNEINISIIPLPFSWIINLRLNYRRDCLIKFVWICVSNYIQLSLLFEF